MSAFQFTGYFTQTVHGWSPGQYAAMVFFGGAIGIGGNIVAGKLADRFGRRSVGFALLGTFPPRLCPTLRRANPAKGDKRPTLPHNRRALAGVHAPNTPTRISS